MGHTQEKSKYAKIFSGYAVIALNQLGYSEKNIKDVILKIEDVIKFTTDEKAIHVINNFLDESTKQIIFEGNVIPIKFNMVKIRDLFEQCEFTEKEYRYIIQRICNALERKHIEYIKDLYDKTEKDIRKIKSIGNASYDFFIYFLKKISH